MNGKRPPHVKPPAYLSPSPPVPKPAEPDADAATQLEKGEDPVRYGDWVRKGIAVDF
ncbi:DUF1674 domain-containing protein [Sphingomonas sp. DBB INV C78]|uniref:DUF1674 domain-containing protein n=1 Tax=Sphingomonas sp. DBB INV C78 TaxID=3349434 RepID=UPI0036D39991